jgi:hypothetical protein
VDDFPVGSGGYGGVGRRLGCGEPLVDGIQRIYDPCGWDPSAESDVTQQEVRASQSKSERVRASQGKSGQVRASRSKSEQVRASQSKSEQVRASQSDGSTLAALGAHAPHYTVCTGCTRSPLTPLHCLHWLHWLHSEPTHLEAVRTVRVPDGRVRVAKRAAVEKAVPVSTAINP